MTVFMKTRNFFALLLAVAMLFVSCEDEETNEAIITDDPIENPDTDKEDDNKQEEVEPNERVDLTLTSEQKKMVSAGNAFAFDMFDRLVSKEQGGDVFFSPLSVELALGMLNEGACGVTSEEIMKVLSFGEAEKDAVNSYYKSLIDQSVSVDNQVDLVIANALVASDAYDIKDSYVSAIGDWYYAKDFILDYSNVNPVEFVNDWVSDRTGGMIPHFVDNVGSVNLLNTICFNALWEEPFNDEATRKVAFNCAAGNVSEVDMMKSVSSYRYLSSDIFDMVCKSYSNGAYRFTLLLPKDGYGVSDVAAVLKNDGLQKYMNAAKYSYVDLNMPSFELEFSVDFKEHLKNMGMMSAFEGGDFSDMVASGDMYVDKVFHKARIKMDESGTCAAAGTIIQMEGASPDQTEPILFLADHPFVYVITEISSTKVFFAGTYSGR